MIRSETQNFFACFQRPNSLARVFGCIMDSSSMMYGLHATKAKAIAYTFLKAIAALFTERN